MDADEHLCPTRFWWVNLQCVLGLIMYGLKIQPLLKKGGYKNVLKGENCHKMSFLKGKIVTKTFFLKGKKTS